MARQNSVYHPNHWKVEGSTPRSALKKMLTQGMLSVNEMTVPSGAAMVSARPSGNAQ